MKLRTYETLFIVQPNATDEEVQAVTQGVENLVTQDGGNVMVSDIWGKRRLAYEVKRFNEGIYVLIRFEASPRLIDTLENQFKLNDDIIRYLVVHFDEKMLRLEDEQKRRNAEALERREEARGRDDEDRPSKPKPAKAEKDESETKAEEKPEEASVEA